MKILGYFREELIQFGYLSDRHSIVYQMGDHVSFFVADDYSSTTDAMKIGKVREFESNKDMMLFIYARKEMIKHRGEPMS